MKKPFLVLTVAVVLLLGALAGSTYLHLSHNITPAAAVGIKRGMTRAQVEQILGGPAGPYYRFHHVVTPLDDWQIEGIEFEGGDYWVADDFAVVVWFDSSDCVVGVGQTSRVIHLGRGFCVNGDNVLPDCLMNWLGWDGLPPIPIE